jgi:hypothetical protein
MDLSPGTRTSPATVPPGVTRALIVASRQSDRIETAGDQVGRILMFRNPDKMVGLTEDSPR